MKIIAIILARGNSKGILNKNIINFCGKPLIAWTIEHCIKGGLNDVYVSSDSNKILSISSSYGAQTIKRPSNLSNDKATSESGLKHALKIIEKKIGTVDWVVTPQVTSPIRSPKDIKSVVQLCESGGFDSLFSVIRIEDHFIWKQDSIGNLNSLNYDFRNRKRRQEIEDKYLENGSLYVFRPYVLRKENNRLGGVISIYEMEKHKMFQIDNQEDLELCTVIMKGYGYC